MQYGDAIIALTKTSKFYMTITILTFTFFHFFSLQLFDKFGFTISCSQN